MDDSPRPTSFSRRDFHVLTGSWIVATFSGCGTLMYPERVGQSRNGRLDWTIVGMDAIGLIFFFIPGLIAFAIDFYNGTIFYPPSYGLRYSGHEELKVIELGKRHPELAEVAEAVSNEIGRPVRLEEGRYFSRELATLEDFWPMHDELAGSSSPTRHG